jgi:hypothetical protein
LQQILASLTQAAHAAITSPGARRSEQFRKRYKISAVAAFALLMKLSQNSNAPLYEIARRLVHADYPPDREGGASND